MEYAIGMIETYGDVAATEALDAAFKSSNVITPVINYIGGGIVTISFFGDVAAVKVAVDCGVAAAQKVGVVLSSTVIARLSEEVFNTIFKDDFKKADNAEVNLSNSIDKKIDSNNDTLNIAEDNDIFVNEAAKSDSSDDGVDSSSSGAINMDSMLLDDNLIDESSDKKNPKKKKKKKK